MKDNFINDFKIYCETVDSIEGLEIIRDNILSFIINLETFTDDYLNKDALDNYKDTLNEIVRLSGILNDLACDYSYVLDKDIREIHVVLKPFNMYEIKDMLQFVCEDCSRLIKDKYGFIEEEHIEQWYRDLYLLFDKYDI